MEKITFNICYCARLAWLPWVVFVLTGVGSASAQTFTETFETQTNNASAFMSNGKVFDIVSRTSTFYIQGGYPGTGWNGTAADNKYIDNSGYAFPSSPTDFSIRTHDASRFVVTSMWLFLSNSVLNQNVTGSVTLTGKLAGVTQFTASASTGFNQSLGVANGFSSIDFSTLGRY